MFTRDPRYVWSDLLSSVVIEVCVPPKGAEGGTNVLP